LTETAAKRRDSHTEGHRNRRKPGSACSLFPALRKCRRRNQKYRHQREHYRHSFLHYCLLMNCRQEVVPGHRAAGLTLEQQIAGKLQPANLD
jgi:hypothetical protein